MVVILDLSFADKYFSNCNQSLQYAKIEPIAHYNTRLFASLYRVDDLLSFRL